MAPSLPVIAITLGDPAGIGPEVIAKTLRDPRLPKGCRYEVLGRPGKTRPGKLTPASGRIALNALEEAVRGCRDGRFAAMVTGPVSKYSIAKLEPGFVGQTEFLAQRCGLPDEAAVMVLTDPKLTVALCSNHCSIKDAVEGLTPERIIYVAKATRAFLRRVGLARRGRALAFAAVNPHMGESVKSGGEDFLVVRLALEALRKEGIAVSLSPADTVFYNAIKHRAFDAVICAYHDQGLIPFKLVAFHTGVNVTLGLPIIRTSPDHGTALDLAGRGLADHRSMLAAVKLAARLARSQKS